jgi:hypothetical protein
MIQRFKVRYGQRQVISDSSCDPWCFNAAMDVRILHQAIRGASSRQWMSGFFISRSVVLQRGKGCPDSSSGDPWCFNAAMDVRILHQAIRGASTLPSSLRTEASDFGFIMRSVVLQRGNGCPDSSSCDPWC